MTIVYCPEGKGIPLNVEYYPIVAPTYAEAEARFLQKHKTVARVWHFVDWQGAVWAFEVVKG